MESVVKWSSLAMMADEFFEAAIDADARLMLRFKAGDLPAFEILFARHARPLVNFAFRFVHNREVAEELAQEVFLKVHDAAASYQPSAKFTTWLYRIATNVCLNELRRPRYRTCWESIETSPHDNPVARQLQLADSGQAGADRQLERQAIAESLKRALDTLPEKQRIAFVLNKYEELSYAEVADVMEISEKAVKSLIHRAKGALAERLKPLLPGLV